MSIKSLPSMEHNFIVKIKGEETGKPFEGSFTYKRPNIGIDSQIARTKAFLDGGLKLDEDTQLIHKILATLKHTLVEYPEWWKDSDLGLELYDLNVVFDIYREVQKFEKEWFDKVWGETDSKNGTKKAKESKEE